MPTLNTVNDYVATMSDFLSVDECLELINLSESLGFADAPITTSSGPSMRKDIRNNDRVMHDDPQLAERLWQRAKPYLPEQLGGTVAVGLNDRFRFYRYDPGQQFNWHLDGAYHAPNGDSSRLTFLIYLNDEFAGGETSFEGFDIKPKLVRHWVQAPVTS